MKTRVKVTRPLKSVVFILTSITLLTGALMPFLSSGRVGATGEVTTRSIQMSNSTPSASGVTYVINFTTATAGLIQAVEVDYCSVDPILGDACSPTPSGFATGTGLGTVSGFGTESGGTWVTASVNGGRTFEYNNSSATGSIAASTPITITVTGNTNPSTTCSSVSACQFYARIFTFVSTGNETTQVAAGGANGSGSAGIVDFGGVALSTASNITVNAKVQEMINFCVDTGGTCGSGTSTVNLGNAQGVLSASTAYLDKTTSYSIQTNANSGVAINVEGPTLTYGGATITNLTSPVISATGASQFGLCTYTASGTITPVTNYAGTGSASTCSAATAPSTPGTVTFYYGAAATSGAGDTIANVTAGAPGTGNVVYLANISATQTAGLYTTTQIYIATGKY